MVSLPINPTIIKQVASIPKLGLHYGIRTDKKKDILFIADEQATLYAVFNRELLNDEEVKYMNRDAMYGGSFYNKLQKWYFDHDIQLLLFSDDDTPTEYGEIKHIINNNGLAFIGNDLHSKTYNLFDVNQKNIIHLLDSFLLKLKNHFNEGHVHDGLLHYKLYHYLPQNGICLPNPEFIFNSMCKNGHDVYNFLSINQTEMIKQYSVDNEVCFVL